MVRRWFGATLAVIGLAAAGWAQDVVSYKDEDWARLPEERWEQLGTADFGKRYFVEGRWLQVHGSGILLFNAKIETKRLLSIAAGPLKDNLTAGLSGLGQKLERRHSVVRVFGRATKGSSGTYLSVTQVLKLPDAHDAYRARLEGLGQDADRIAALAREAEAEARRYEDEQLRAVAREIAQRELEVRARGLPANDYAGRARLAERFRVEAQDPRSAIELYSSIYEASDAPEALKAKASEALVALQAVRVRSGADRWSWVTYQEFKRSEGYLLRRPQEGDPFYIRREVAELLGVIEEETQRQALKIDPPRQNPFKAGQDARTGKIRRGQTYSEVRTAAEAFPVRVFHRIERWGAKGRALWTQWELPSGDRVYFLSVEVDEDGRVFFPPSEVVDRKPAGTPWPTE